MAGCGGGDSEERQDLTRTIKDDRLGYELKVPADWKPVGPQRAGAPRAFGGAGRGCVITATEPLPDVSSEARFLDYARGRLDGEEDEVESVQGVDAGGVRVRFERSGTTTEGATFAVAGRGIAVSCTERDEARFGRLATTLRSIYATVRLREDGALARVQPELAALEAVDGAALNRDGEAVTGLVRIEMGEFDRRAGATLRGAVKLLADELPDRTVGINVTETDNPQQTGFARYDPRTRRGTFQVVPKEAESFELSP